MLEFNPKWRFKPPSDGKYHNSKIPKSVISEFKILIIKIANQRNSWSVLEIFKRAFAAAAGQSYSRSSSEGWANHDLDSEMLQASKNAPLFLEAFYETCKTFNDKDLFQPDAKIINALCEKNNIGYVLKPPKLMLREKSSKVKLSSVAVIENVPTLAEQANELIQKSLEQSEKLFSEEHYREAVQENLWALESVTTAFRGVESSGDVVRGKYFNEIVKDLKRLNRGSVLDRVLEWMTNMHGFLSSPTGGGVRHGFDLKEGIPIGAGEARLFCNLIRSYINYLLTEHEEVTKQRRKKP